MKKIFRYILKLMIKLPIINYYSIRWYSLLGMKIGKNCRISTDITVIGDYSNIELKSNAEINTGCFIIAKDKIIIGNNSTLAYQATILTSSNPNGPYNLLSLIYKKMSAPVIIGDNSWIGARAIILPGIKIGSFSIVAAGAVVRENVPNYTIVAGVPAKPIKKIDPELFLNKSII